MKKYWYYILIGIVALFVITNPSQSAFKAYLGESSNEGLQRNYNFFVCSIYSYEGHQYFAIAGNFFILDQPVSPSTYIPTKYGHEEKSLNEVDLFNNSIKKTDTTHLKKKHSK